MASQGADFNFDLNMDFSTVFSSTKPTEGETSGSFFFGDEGVDTTTSVMDPIMFPQTFDMQQSLSLDDTSGSTSVWDSHLTSEMQNTLNTFPPTPTHLFDSPYTQPQYVSTLGKRSSQLDSQDFPQPKRQEIMSDFTLFSPMPSSMTSSWSLDAQLNPATGSLKFGISDEAADMCAMWFNKYAILPSDRHIDSLSQLTGEPVDDIRRWFGRLMKQGMSTDQGDSAYKSQTSLSLADQFWVPQLPLEDSTQYSATTPELPCDHETTTVTQSANTLRGGKKSRCTPTDDISQLSRDSSKIYQCTRKCGKRYGRKCDWKRNEEEGYPCKSWVCSLCTTAGVENVKPCFRKYHFAQHFRNIHPGASCDEYEEASVVCSKTEFPRKCGFCKHRFASRQERIDHIAEHFKQGKCMLDWDDSEDSDNSDNTDTDDDRPSGDDSDNSRPADQPPPRHPRGGPNSKYNGGYNGSGNDGGGAQGGYFQFQLSQLSEGEAGSECYYAQQHTKPTHVLQGLQQRAHCSSEPPSRSNEAQSSIGSSPIIGKLDMPTRDHESALARDALSRPLTQQCRTDTEIALDQQKFSQEHLFPETATSDTGLNGLEVLQRSRHRTPLNKTTAPTSTKKCTSTEVTKHRTPKVWEVARTMSAAPMFFSGAQANRLKTTLVDGEPGSGKTSVPKTLATDHKVIQSQFVASVDSKILQTIPMNSQSFLSVRFLGSGGFSTVDEVVHRETNLRLGRKTLKNRGPAAIQDLLEEVSVLKKLRHPHVIRFLGAYSQGDKMSILLSPIADTTLSLWLDRFSAEKPDNFSQIVAKMFGCLASSVRYLHEQRPIVKHLDIKPQNVLIVEGDGEFPHVVLCDFGVSTSDDLSGQTQPLTRQYVAPEVLACSTRTVAADIWSLGCVFTEMASVAYGQDNAKWLKLRKEFSGRTGKYYWQDVSGLQDRLTVLLEDASSTTEKTVVRTLKAMLRPVPAKRPDAASLTLVFTPAPCCLAWPNENAAYPASGEEMHSVESLFYEDGCDCRAQLHRDGETTKAHTHGLQSAKTWLEECSHSHGVCNHATLREAKTLPSRLLDIQPEGRGSSVHVINSALIGQHTGSVEYVALSNVWNASHATLTTESQARLETNIPTADLSDALNTAINAARRLGYRYLWTDSLCVVQNSEDDKRNECANMASVFRNAALTLILDSIDNGLEDFRQSLAQASSAFAWDTRAWSLQERLLSHRFLHLGQEQMYWECNSLKASETFPQGLPLLVWEKAHSKHGMLDSEKLGAKAELAQSTTTNAQHKSGSLDPHRPRNCQRTRRQGDSIGNMEAAQTILPLSGASACPSTPTPTSTTNDHRNTTNVHDSTMHHTIANNTPPNHPVLPTTPRANACTHPTNPILARSLSSTCSAHRPDGPPELSHSQPPSAQRQTEASARLDQRGVSNWDVDGADERMSFDVVHGESVR
ncbi:hypothetical protein BDU57DRAFT_519171 [Ampelomyces quisqualis]|uniref:Protein kinase domain-containing protein n=1 Tax=Ampelomyces quisqualis TaxID=50730 RepID=A0A6A5QIE0_AMPQU|nr:hypothetical protein BDU57DRAFT_519171 [Ampelomyces quisqualis]